MSKRVWTEEMIELLRQKINDYSYNELAVMLGKTVSSVKSKCLKLGLTVTRDIRVQHINKVRTDIYSQECVDWIKDNHKNYDTVEEMLPIFNKKFNKSISLNTFRALLKRKGIVRGEEFMKISFAKRRGKHNESRERYKIGDEIIKKGYVYVKVADYVLPKAVRKDYWEAWNKNWKLKQVKIYEDYHNVKVKNNQIVIFLDGNTRNFDIENLCCIDRKIAGAINASKMSGKGIVTKAGIEVLKTMRLLKEIAN